MLYSCGEIAGVCPLTRSRDLDHPSDAEGDRGDGEEGALEERFVDDGENAGDFI